MDSHGASREDDAGTGASPLRPALWLILAALAAISIGAWKFGGRFLVQFFLSPFQFFILVPLALALFSLKTGIMPLKSGGKIEKTKAPAAYWRAVWFCVMASALCFVINVFVSWVVVARQ